MTSTTTPETDRQDETDLTQLHAWDQGRSHRRTLPEEERWTQYDAGANEYKRLDLFRVFVEGRVDRGTLIRESDALLGLLERLDREGRVNIAAAAR